MAITFQQVDYRTIDVDVFHNYADKLIFQTKEWISFLEKTQNAKPVVLKIFEDGNHIGFFSGLLFKKFGIPIMGSPFRGWTTLYMGFNLNDDIDPVKRAGLLKPLWEYIRKTYKCIYFEVIDRFITEEAATAQGLRYDLQDSLALDLSGTEEELQLRFSKHCRKHIRKFDKSGAVCHIVEPTEAFAEEFYEQLCKVFGYQRLVPSYDLERVKQLFEALKSTDRLLCLRAVDPEGRCCGMSISFGFNGRSYAWASTSMREGTDYLQSEGLRWHAVQHWREMACWDYDMVGVREYKYRFNPTEIHVPRIIFTKFRLLITARNLAQKAYWMLNSLKGKLKGKK